MIYNLEKESIHTFDIGSAVRELIYQAIFFSSIAAMLCISSNPIPKPNSYFIGF